MASLTQTSVNRIMCHYVGNTAGDKATRALESSIADHMLGTLGKRKADGEQSEPAKRNTKASRLEREALRPVAEEAFRGAKNKKALFQSLRQDMVAGQLAPESEWFANLGFHSYGSFNKWFLKRSVNRV